MFIYKEMWVRRHNNINSVTSNQLLHPYLESENFASTGTFQFIYEGIPHLNDDQEQSVREHIASKAMFTGLERY